MTMLNVFLWTMLVFQITGVISNFRTVYGSKDKRATSDADRQTSAVALVINLLFVVWIIYLLRAVT
jgi:hypothetical protein